MNQHKILAEELEQAIQDCKDETMKSLLALTLVGVKAFESRLCILDLIAVYKGNHLAKYIEAMWNLQTKL